jgi:ABC-type branched-subunit amino acid transport system substrate-binding protein
MRLSIGILASLFIVVSRPVFSENRTESIGMLLPLSGPYASVGADNRVGIDAALAERGSASGVSLVLADSHADPRQSVSEFRKLSESDGVLVVYAMRGPVGMAVNPLSRRAKMPLVGGVGNKHFTTGNEFAFQAWPTSEREGEFLAEQLELAGVKRVSIVTVEDDWPVAVSEELSLKAAQHGLSVAGEWRVLPTESDFRAIAGRLKTESADAIFLNVGIAQIGPFVKQVRDIGVKTQIYSNFWAAKPEVRSGAGDRLIGVRYVEMRTDSPALPANASGATLSAYVATHLILQARSQVEGALTRGSLFGALSAQREVRTEAGVFPIQERKIQFPLIVREIK